jgi:hypothetical protein
MLPAIHAEMFLKTAAAIDPINAGPVVTQPGAQGAAQAVPERMGFRGGQRITAASGM